MQSRLSDFHGVLLVFDRLLQVADQLLLHGDVTAYLKRHQPSDNKLLSGAILPISQLFACRLSLNDKKSFIALYVSCEASPATEDHTVAPACYNKSKPSS